MSKKIKMEIDGETYIYEPKIYNIGDDKITVTYNEKSFVFLDRELRRDIIVRNSLDNKSDFEIVYKEGIHTFKISNHKNKTRTKKNNEVSNFGDMILSPMPGRILRLLVKENDVVTKGQALLVMEAMKMEHTLKAPSDGSIEAIFCKEGEQVKGKMELIKLEQNV